MKKNKSISKTLFLFIFTVFAIILFLISSLIVIPNYEKIELKQNQSKIDAIVFNIENEIDYIKGILSDYGYWDDTYEFVENKNSDYIDENFREGTNTLEDLNIDFILYVNKKQEILFSKYQQKLNDINKELFEKSVINKFINEEKSFLLTTLQQRPFYLVKEEILKSDGEGESNGYIFSGKLITNEDIKDVSKVFQHSQLVLKKTKEHTNHKTIKNRYFDEISLYSSIEGDYVHNTLEFYAKNELIFTIKVENTAEILLEGMSVSTNYNLSILALFCILLVLIYRNQRILRNFSKQLEEQVFIKTKELEELNDTLEHKVEDRTKELQEQKTIFETLFNDTADGISLLKNGKFIDCNNSISNFFGYTKQQLLSLNPIALSPKYQPNGKESESEVQKMVAQCIMNGSNRFEWLHLTKDKKEIWFEVVLTKILINDEIVIHAIWRDIDEKKALELEILKRSKELEEALENLTLTQNKLVEAEKMSSLGVLVAGIAHEINTPIGIGLTGATHFIELTNKLKDKYDNQQMSQKEFENYLNSSVEIASLIDTNLHRTASLVKNFKQISFDQSSEEKREINFKSYVDEILFSINNITKKTNIEIINSSDKDINIITYPGAISQVITNLIINSIRHGFEEKEKGVITIDTSYEKDFIKLVYKDNGKGIDENTLPKIFDPFFTTNREDGGTGLGLNIIYNIVSNTLHGTISCKSEKNNGVEFTILFQEDKSKYKINKEVLWQI